MRSQHTTIDKAEVFKFAQYVNDWWDLDGPLKTLHDINPTRMHFIVEHASILDKTVLDLGCGGGILCERLTELGAKVTGLDAEEELIMAAAQHASVNDLDIQYVCSPVEEYLTGQSEVFDIITCMEMLEHVSKPQQVIQEAYRLLKPGGKLFLSTINRTSKAYASAILGAEYILNILPRQTHDYDKFIKPSELSTMLRDEGFEVTAMSGMDYNPWTRRALLSEDVSVNYLLVAIKGE